MQLGWGPYLRDVTATGNVIRRTKIGIAVSVAEGAGPALIANNLIAEAERGAILGMRWDEVATEELVDGGAVGRGSASKAIARAEAETVQHSPARVRISPAGRQLGMRRVAKLGHESRDSGSSL